MKYIQYFNIVSDLMSFIICTEVATKGLDINVFDSIVIVNWTIQYCYIAHYFLLLRRKEKHFFQRNMSKPLKGLQVMHYIIFD